MTFLRTFHVFPEIERWAEKEKLTLETLKILKEDGFATLETLSLLTPQDVDGYYASTNRLLKEQCLRLKKAVDKLNEQSSPEQVKDTGGIASKECQKDRSEGLIPSL